MKRVRYQITLLVHTHYIGSTFSTLVPKNMTFKEVLNESLEGTCICTQPQLEVLVIHCDGHRLVMGIAPRAMASGNGTVCQCTRA